MSDALQSSSKQVIHIFCVVFTNQLTTKVKSKINDSISSFPNFFVHWEKFQHQFTHIHQPITNADFGTFQFFFFDLPLDCLLIFKNSNI